VSLAIGCLWMAFYFRNLGSLPLLPAYDPSAEEVITAPSHKGMPENA